MLTLFRSRLLSPCVAVQWLVAIVAAATAGRSSELQALQAAEPMTIDGKLDEKIWARARGTQEFFGPLNADGVVSPAKTKTEVRVVWNADTIYLAFLCEGAPEPTTLTERDSLLHQEEVVEVFLDFLGQGTDYVELQVSATGVVADLYHHWPERPTFTPASIDEIQRSRMNSDRAWNMAGFKAATGPWKENGQVRGWIAEMALPVASLSREPNSTATLTDGKTFFANFVHYRYPPQEGGTAELEQATWQPVLRGRPHVTPMAMGAVHCVGNNPTTLWRGAWKDGSQLLVNDAHRAFSAAEAGSEQRSRESRLGEAVTLLNLQPKTAANVDRAALVFDGLVNESDSDEIAVMAEYFRARIEQIHRSPTDLVRALNRYDELLRRHPDRFYAQMGAVKACLLRLYATQLTQPVLLRLADAEKIETVFTFAETRRDYHLLMADAYARWGGDATRELHHLLAAEGAGQLNRTALADLALHIAELSRAQGERARAIVYYRKYLAQYSREVRVFMVEQRLRELEAMP